MLICSHCKNTWAINKKYPHHWSTRVASLQSMLVWGITGIQIMFIYSYYKTIKINIWLSLFLSANDFIYGYTNPGQYFTFTKHQMLVNRLGAYITWEQAIATGAALWNQWLMICRCFSCALLAWASWLQPYCSAGSAAGAVMMTEPIIDPD